MTVANKIIYGNNTLIDLTSDTATASDVAVGKTFHLASGMIATGALQGVEVESGTWSPTSNTVRGTINFTNTHDEPPAAFVVWDTGDTTSGISAVFEVCFDHEALFGEELTGRASSYKATRYGSYYSSSTSSSSFIRNCSHGRSDTGDSDDNYYRYHATESCIRPLVLSGSSYGWRSARTYKWVAIWV